MIRCCADLGSALVMFIGNFQLWKVPASLPVYKNIFTGAFPVHCLKRSSLWQVIFMQYAKQLKRLNNE